MTLAIDKKKKYHKEDFKKIFNIAYLDHNKVDDSKLFTHDIYKDKEYTINERLNDKLEEHYGEQIAQGYIAPMHIKWVNKMVQYGVFAEQDIKRGEMVCEYTGLLCADKDDAENLYLWDYPTIMYEDVLGKKRRKKQKYCIDAQNYGNYARFINHTVKKYQNVGIQIIPAQNFWHVVYVAQRDIAKGQQLLTHYGVAYWRDRQIVPVAILP